ncbi:putative 3-oxoacyl-[acyl-carrier-protein] reductase [Variovorax paradoxus B4]|uniref:2-dehydro-3-deoxy-D-gluconate 5-dehydrogenase n=2 Tax=Variovorax paradoxus TaxID=34073 RepID=A0A0H2LW89_VARPD|nr:glucose 1-dehydrogenase [Variovorax paradoxus]AGU53261.1 putative 3-oxoacyl-[acyl-carrier-protein] reductase [Variovorax paradoxus B4]KLN54454.1 2-dehydro-3-deoxy-D-gluconate 5-dehydrogenase [Variovorax paradoxus]
MKYPETVAPRLLEGRLALITGAGQGNGRTLALGLAQAGARVIVTDMNEGTVGETARSVRLEGGEAWAFVLDVTSSDDCRALAQRVEKEIGQVDLLVNNAGVIIRESMSSDKAEANWKKTIDVNVHGTFNVTLAWLPAIKARKGSIINIASIAAYAGQGASLGYSPSKGAIKMFTQSLAQELAPAGVRVNALAPGVIETPMTAATRDDPERLASFMTRIPMGRVGQTEDLVGPVIFLASDMSRYVTGITLPVDGGFLAV